MDEKTKLRLIVSPTNDELKRNAASAATELEPDVQLLAVPHTFPNNGSGLETLIVIDDCNDNCRIHVALADVIDDGETWGMYLADIVRAIARDHSYLCTDRPDGDLFAAICDGFASRVAQLKTEM